MDFSHDTDGNDDESSHDDDDEDVLHVDAIRRLMSAICEEEKGEEEVRSCW